MCRKFILEKKLPKAGARAVSERGFVITVDSFLSVVVMTLLIVLSFFFLSKVTGDSWNLVDLKNIVSDKSAVLEKNLLFEDSILRSSSELLEVSLNSSPDPYCFEATLFNESLSPLVHALKAGCTKSTIQIISSERTFMVRDDNGSSFYIARVEGWVK